MAKQTTQTSSPLFAVVADVHLANHKAHGGEMVDGINARGRITLDALAQALKAAREQGVAAFVVAGDLFDAKRPDPALVAEAVKLFREEATPTYLLPGNHDMLDAEAGWHRTALAPLHLESKVITPNEGKTWFIEDCQSFAFGFIPYRSGASMNQVVSLAIPEMRAACKNPDAPLFLFGHFGLYGDNAPPWQKDSPDAVAAEHLTKLLDRYNVRSMFVGHYHQGREWEGERSTLMQVGTLNPCNFSDEGFFPTVGGVAFGWLDGRVGRMECAGIRFTTVRTQADARAVAEAIEENKENIVHLRAVKDAGLEDILPAPAQDSTVEVVAPAALAPATFSNTLIADAQEAIDAFVKQMQLPSGVAVAEVIKRAQSYWEQAKD